MNGDSEDAPNFPNPTTVPAPLPRRRLQFSLASLLWLTTVVACLAALWAMYQKLRTTEAEAVAEVARAKVEAKTANDEVQKYRGEMGYLDISDPNKVYARGIRIAEDLRWSWRIYIPKKSKFLICLSDSYIPANGASRGSGSYGQILPGEHLIDAFAQRMPDDKWRCGYKINDGNGGSLTRDSDDKEFLGGNFSGGAVGEGKQVVAEPGSPMVLLRLRKNKIISRMPNGDVKSATEDPQPCDGFMIWIEEAKQ